MGAVLGGAFAIGLSTATQAAADFETAMVEVQKVTDATTASRLSDSVRELAQTIPLAQEELAGLAADAARFGVRGVENIEAFTEATAKMATATNLGANEAGQALARLAELTDTPVEEIENLGSAINELSNNFATSSDEIVDSMLRSSAALSQFGLNQREIAGFSAALNEVSESSQRAGTRLRRVAQELMNPRNVQDIAAALGMNVEAFKRMRREAPVDLIRRMAQEFANGTDAADQLRTVLSTASRQAIAGLAQNLDGLDQALTQSNSSFEKGTSLQREFDAATDTFNARLQLLKNNLNDVAITVGNDVLPVLNPFLTTLNDLLSGAKDLSDVFGQETAAQLQGIVTAFQNLFEPVKQNADEVFELAQNLWFFSQQVLPAVAPALRDLRFILEGTADALGVINTNLNKAIDLWDQLPTGVRQGAITGVRGAVSAPVGGIGGLRGVESARNLRIILDERTDIVESRIEAGAGRVLVRNSREADRLQGRGTGVR